MENQFKIFEITKDVVEEIMTRSDESHYHDFEEIIVVTGGSLVHAIDYKIETVGSNIACYVPMGKMHKLIPHSELRGWVINYQTELVPNSKMKFYSNFFANSNINIHIDTLQNQLIPLCKILQYEINRSDADLKTISNMLMGLISLLETERNRETQEIYKEGSAQMITFENFLRILEDNFARNEGVRFYADKLNMSERNLNIICNSIFQKSVSEIIETRKLVEAKQLLLHSAKTVSEIGFEIGYNEKSYFTRVFKNKTGITPSEFREKSKKTIS